MEAKRDVNLFAEVAGLCCGLCAENVVACIVSGLDGVRTLIIEEQRCRDGFFSFVKLMGQRDRTGNLNTTMGEGIPNKPGMADPSR